MRRFVIVMLLVFASVSLFAKDPPMEEYTITSVVVTPNSCTFSFKNSVGAIFTSGTNPYAERCDGLSTGTHIKGFVIGFQLYRFYDRLDKKGEPLYDKIPIVMITR